MNTSTERRGLGRGLGELFQRTEIERTPTPPTQPNMQQTSVDGSHGRTSSESSAAPFQVPAGSYFAELPISSIVPNARQPRTAFDEEAMAELVESIKEVERTTIAAALTGSRDLAVKALALHPLVPSVNTARRIFDAYAGRQAELTGMFS
jgi:hypothetical protein